MMGSPNKKSITPEGIEQAISQLRASHEKLVMDYNETFEKLGEDKQIAFLGNENKQLREELKRLNEFITQLVEYRRLSMKS